MSSLVEHLIAVHDALEEAKLPHAFGGAIALGYCIHEPRGTRDLDINIFVTRARADDVFAALPDDITVRLANVEEVQQDGQTRLMWDDMPLDIFLNVHPFHEEVARGVRQVPFSGRVIPVVGCTALAVFKSLISRTKDWADIEEMVAMGEMSLADTIVWVTQIAGSDSPAASRMQALAT